MNRRDPSIDEPLDETALDRDPIVEFGRWHAEAKEIGLLEPDAAVLSTCSAEGIPSARVVLVRGIGSDGFRFYTNYESRKGRELIANPHAAITYHWQDLRRQVRIVGSVEKATAEASDAYFAARPRGSQLGAWASEQSREVASRAELEGRVDEMEARFQGREVTRPPHWGGFLLVPTTIEFWHHRNSRLHDRIVYRRDATGWSRRRLSP